MRLPVARLLFPAFALLAGCAEFSPDGGMAPVVESARSDLGLEATKIADDLDAARAGERVRALLRKGLTADRAVQIALVNNMGLQAAYNDLGVSEAKFVQASLPPNPAVSLLDLRGHMEFSAEQRLIGDLLALATLPRRREIALAAYRKAQLAAVAATLRLAIDVRRQY